MSSTNKTANYNLSQFIGSDKPAWLVDYNGDMAAIDTQMKVNADAAAAAQSTANGADGKADANATAISSLNTQINGDSGIADDLSSVQGAVNTINSLIGSGEPTTSQKTLIGAINELDAENGTLSELDTTVKASLVAAINEVFSAANASVLHTVTADGVKTYAEILAEFEAVISAVSATNRYKLALRIGNTVMRYGLVTGLNAFIATTIAYGSPNSAITRQAYFNNGANYTEFAVTDDANAPTMTSLNASVPSEGIVFALIWA